MGQNEALLLDGGGLVLGNGHALRSVQNVAAWLLRGCVMARPERVWFWFSVIAARRREREIVCALAVRSASLLLFKSRPLASGGQAELPTPWRASGHKSGGRLRARPNGARFSISRAPQPLHIRAPSPLILIHTRLGRSRALVLTQGRRLRAANANRAVGGEQT